jgi:hypothetical protein
MNSLQSVILCCAYVATASPAFAEGSKITGSMSGATIYPMSFEGEGFAPISLNSVGVLMPVTDHWGLVLKMGMASPMTVFRPAPQAQAGVSVRLSDGFVLGSTGIYRYVPNWSGTPGDAHLVGVSVGPTVLLPSKIALTFPAIAATYNATTTRPGFSVAFEVTFQLPKRHTP